MTTLGWQRAFAASFSPSANSRSQPVEIPKFLTRHPGPSPHLSRQRAADTPERRRTGAASRLPAPAGRRARTAPARQVEAPRQRRPRASTPMRVPWTTHYGSARARGVGRFDRARPGRLPNGPPARGHSARQIVAWTRPGFRQGARKRAGFGSRPNRNGRRGQFPLPHTSTSSHGPPAQSRHLRRTAARRVVFVLMALPVACGRSAPTPLLPRVFHSAG